LKDAEHLRGVKAPLLWSQIMCRRRSGIYFDGVAGRFAASAGHRYRRRGAGSVRTPAPDAAFLPHLDRVQWALGVSLLNLFPLPREAGFRRSFAYAGEAVDRGYSVLVFPEGRTRRMER